MKEMWHLALWMLSICLTDGRTQKDPTFSLRLCCCHYEIPMFQQGPCLFTLYWTPQIILSNPEYQKQTIIQEQDKRDLQENKGGFQDSYPQR